MANNYEDTIKSLIDKLQQIQYSETGNSWQGIGPMDAEEYGDIDIHGVISESINYWNETVEELINNFQTEINEYGNIHIGTTADTVGKEHDAAYNFSENVDECVLPNPNIKGELYSERRTDEIKSVMANESNLDYTISEINDYLTRLLMPQYSRRVEVEDLNRNFWVIGQNLSLLNNLVLNIENAPWKSAIEGLMSEIIGLWENVYRIWQAILYLEGRIDNVVESVEEIGASAAKTKVIYSYDVSFGVYTNTFSDTKLIDRLYKNTNGTFDLQGEKLHLTDFFTFKEGDIEKFGIAPAIEKEEIPYLDAAGIEQKGWVAYMPYNKITNLDLYSKEEEMDNDFINNNGKGLIRIERKFGERPASEIFKMANQMNFTLVSPLLRGENEYIDNLISVENPFLEFLQFIRDVTYYTISDEFAGVVPESGTNVAYDGYQSGSLAWINFTHSTDWRKKYSSSIPNRIKMAWKFLNIAYPDVLKETAYETYYEDTMNIFKIEDASAQNLAFWNHYIQYQTGINGLDYFIDQFYTIFERIGKILSNNTLDLTLWNDKENSYILNEDDVKTQINKFKTALNVWNTTNSTNGEGFISGCPTYLLFSGQQDYFKEDDLTHWITINNNKYKIEADERVLSALPVIKWDLLSANVAGHGGENNLWSKEVMSGQEPWIINNELTDFIPSSNENASTIKDRMLNIANAASKQQFMFVEQENNVFGCSNICPWNSNNLLFGLWFDFVHQPSGYGQRVLNCQYLNSFTANLWNGWYIYDYNWGMSCGKTGLKWYNIYNNDIQFTLNGCEKEKYEDFLRYSKPYPSFSIILNQKSKENYSHIETLNDVNNYISYNAVLDTSAGGKTSTLSFIDGYYGFYSGSNYPVTLIEPKIDAIDYDYTYKEDGGEYYIYLNRKREENGNELFYYGPVYNVNNALNVKQYTIASTDLVNAHQETIDDLNEGRTQWENTNLKENPNISISYLSSEDDAQLLSIFIAKDTTNKIVFRTPEQEEIVIDSINLEVKTLKIGDYWPSNFELGDEIKDKVSGSNNYTTEIYGDGAYYSSAYTNLSCGELNDNQQIIYGFGGAFGGEDDSKTSIGASESNPAKFHFVSYCGTSVKNYITETYKDKTKPLLIIAKYGTKFWWGQDGSQWEQGVIHSLYYRESGENGKCYHLGNINAFDGFWEEMIGIPVFSGPTKGDVYYNSRGRALSITSNSENPVKINSNGAIEGKLDIIWKDRNNLIDNEMVQVGKATASIAGNVTNTSSDATITIDKTSQYYLPYNGNGVRGNWTQYTENNIMLATAPVNNFPDHIIPSTEETFINSNFVYCKYEDLPSIIIE